MLLRDAEVGTRLGMARSTTWDRVRDGTLTRPIRRGTKWSRWPSGEIARIEYAIVAGATDDELRELSRQLERDRLTQKPAIESGVAA